jgi:DNA-directed RNA polymerase specialized sigma24 family protein
MLRQWDGLSFGDVGERLGIAEDAARMRFQRALGRLARLVQRLRAGELQKVLAEGGAR